MTDDEPGDDERRLAPQIVTVWRLSLAIGGLLALLPAVVAGLVLRPTLGGIGAGAGLVLLAAGTVWYPRARFERWRWRLGRLALELHHGVLIRREMGVPYFRIQHIEITRGPLERALGLASLQVTTASATGSASLPGIPAGDAPRVRAELLSRAADAVGGQRDGISDAV